MAAAAAMARIQPSTFPSWCRKDVQKGEWTVVFNEILEYAHLVFSPAANSMLCIVTRFTMGGIGKPEWFFMTHKEIEKRFGLCVSAVENAFRELIGASVVECEKLGNRRRYRLVLDKVRGLKELFRAQLQGKTKAAKDAKSVKSTVVEMPRQAAFRAPSAKEPEPVEEANLCPRCGFDLDSESENSDDLESSPYEERTPESSGYFSPSVPPENDAWERVKQTLRAQIPAEAYANWVERSHLLELTAAGVLRVAVTSEFMLDWLQIEYASKVAAALPSGTTVSYVIEAEAEPIMQSNAAKSATAPSPAEVFVQQLREECPNVAQPLTEQVAANIHAILSTPYEAFWRVLSLTRNRRRLKAPSGGSHSWPLVYRLANDARRLHLDEAGLLKLIEE
jgi:hypothetical protein